MKLRFIYAGDDARSDMPAPFVGVEIRGVGVLPALSTEANAGEMPTPHSAAIVGRRVTSAAFDRLETPTIPSNTHYIVLPWPQGLSIPAAGQVLKDIAAAAPSMSLLVDVPPGTEVRAAWQWLEATDRPNVQLAWPADAPDRPALVVPTLNLRIGLVRITRLDEKAQMFVRRLAGVGSSAFIVIDPPAGEGRLETARSIAHALYETVVPPKPSKIKPAAPKPVVK